MLHNSSLEADCKDCPIRYNAVCSRCEPLELLQLEQIKYYRNYESGQSIVWAGDEMGFVASIVRGVATISKTLEDGRRQMLGLLMPSDFIGRPGRSNAPYDVVAVGDVTLCCFRRKPFEDMLITTPHLVERLLDMTLDELDAARDWMLILGRKTAREKIASMFSIMVRKEAKMGQLPLKGPVDIDLPLTREAMSDYLGLTLETVSRQISALRADGVIELQTTRRVHVPDVRRLFAETGDDS